MELQEVLGCPYCQAGLLATGELSAPWSCRACGRGFGQEGRMPVLFRREDAVRLDEFALQYRDARLREGWQPPTPEQALALPWGRPGGAPVLYWEVRRQSFRALMDVLAREGPSPARGPAADLGAGMGWLSFRLANAGYQVLAVDASRDPDWGLGASERYYLPKASFQPVLGDLEHPPLQVGRLSLILFNASLHYASDLDGALRRAVRALQPAGRVVILDAPVGRSPRAGTGRGDRHFGRQELHEALLDVGLSPRWLPIRRGARWWRHQAKVILRRDARFSFPMILADRLS